MFLKIPQQEVFRVSDPNAGLLLLLTLVNVPTYYTLLEISIFCSKNQFLEILIFENWIWGQKLEFSDSVIYTTSSMFYDHDWKWKLHTLLKAHDYSTKNYLLGAKSEKVTSVQTSKHSFKLSVSFLMWYYSNCRKKGLNMTVLALVVSNGIVRDIRYKRE